MNDGSNAEAYSPEGVDSSNAFGEDVLQMALKMATGELDETAVDLETALTPNTIQTPQRSQNDESTENNGKIRHNIALKKASCVSCIKFHYHRLF